MAGFFTLLYLFAAGLALDWLVTWHYRAVALRRRGLAALTNLVILVATLTVFKELLASDSSLLQILSYSTGAAIGCYLALGGKSNADSESLPDRR